MRAIKSLPHASRGWWAEKRDDIQLVTELVGTIEQAEVLTGAIVQAEELIGLITYTEELVGVLDE